jgi:hypothetical protein
MIANAHLGATVPAEQNARAATAAAWAMTRRPVPTPWPAGLSMAASPIGAVLVRSVERLLGTRNAPHARRHRSL